MNLADIFIAIGMFVFLFAELRQLRKVIRKKTVSGLSLTHYNWKVFAILSAMMGYILNNLYMSICVITIELLVTLCIIKSIMKDRLKEYKLTKLHKLKYWLREWI